MNYYIYKMIHVPTGRVYVGQRRCPAGKTPDTDSYHGSGKIWKRIYNAHPDECVKVVIGTYNSKDDVNQAEIDLIRHYKAVWGDFCVNITDGGEGWCNKHTEESKAKMSATRKAWTPEYRVLVSRHISEAHQGKPAWNRGLHQSDETIRKNSEAHKGKESPRKGVHLSEETKRKLSAALKGRHLSEETRRKIGEAGKGRRRSKETRRKIGEARRAYWKARKENA